MVHQLVRRGHVPPDLLLEAEQHPADGLGDRLATPARPDGVGRCVSGCIREIQRVVPVRRRGAPSIIVARLRRITVPPAHLAHAGTATAACVLGRRMMRAATPAAIAIHPAITNAVEYVPLVSRMRPATSARIAAPSIWLKYTHP